MHEGRGVVDLRVRKRKLSAVDALLERLALDHPPSRSRHWQKRRQLYQTQCANSDVWPQNVPKSC